MKDIADEKKRIRELFKNKRKEISAKKREEIDVLLLNRVISLEEYKKSGVILLYYPVKGEPNILEIAQHALNNGKKIAFPVSNINDFSLTFKFVNNIDELMCGAYSIPEPPENAPIYNGEKNTLCIVPGLTFDRFGKRVGYGKGFYDRFLCNFDGVSVGVCYFDLMSDVLACENTDIGVDIVVNEKEKLYINVGKANKK